MCLAPTVSAQHSLCCHFFSVVQRLVPDSSSTAVCIMRPNSNVHSIMLQVTIDNSTTSAYSLINIVCRDRKGLVYDLMRTVKDIHIRVAYGKVHVRQDYMCEADLFVQEVDGHQITDQ